MSYSTTAAMERTCRKTSTLLALRCTDIDSKQATVLRVSWLADVIADFKREKRNLVVLDACYSGAALGEFINMSEGSATQTVTQQFFSAVPNPEDTDYRQFR